MMNEHRSDSFQYKTDKEINLVHVDGEHAAIYNKEAFPDLIGSSM